MGGVTTPSPVTKRDGMPQTITQIIYEVLTTYASSAAVAGAATGVSSQSVSGYALSPSRKLGPARLSRPLSL